ncbi:MAG: hypothetical protein IKH29_02490 [Methanobrevibacter sp.]|uniref:hypothetical protein n=1 Tax=Methanobrevibacter sp. TaxID=66852 RepID=UPI0025DA25E9|nr:hypothetical protein [Methanobrevibacter sp.]MBR3112566.1 hypothetical protein [Methanobrevibacter sp.]
MDFKKSIFIIGIVLILVLSVSIVSAEGNTTDSSSNDMNDEGIVDENIDLDKQYQYEHIKNDEFDAEIEITDNNLNVHGNANDWIEIGLEYNYYDNEYYYLENDDNGYIYPEYYYEGDDFNQSFANLLNGAYRLSIGDVEFPFTINLPTKTNLTIENDRAIIKINTNDPGAIELFDENDEEVDDSFELLEQGLNVYEYSLPNGNYVARTTDCKNNTEIPFTINVPTLVNSSLVDNNLIIEVSANKNLNYLSWRLNKDSGTIGLNKGYGRIKFSNLKNGEYNLIIYKGSDKVFEMSNITIKYPNTKITTKQNVTFTYGSNNLIYATIEQDSEYGSARPVLYYNGKIIKGTEKKANQFAFKFNKPVGIYQVELQLDDGNYYAEPVKVNVTITKAAPKLTVKKSYSTTKSYVKLRAILQNQDEYYLNEGVVNFTINGKTYSVKVKDGEAIKKIKLTKAKTYTLKTKFSSDNYKTKSVSSKVVVSKAKKSYVIKVGKYSCKVSFKDYLKILDAKSWNSVFSKTYNTRKTIKIKYYTYKTKKVTYTKKKLLAHSWISKGKIYSRSYASANIAPKGYKYAGAKIVQKGYDVKEYQIYKKTVKKKIKSKAKYKTCKVYISIDTYRWSKNHDVKAMACTDSSYLMNLDKDYNYYSKEKVL